jgi:NADH:ubiquinone oxidoreductase subunit C
MDTAGLLLTAEELVKPWTQVVTHPEKNRTDIVISPENLEQAVAALISAHWGYLSAITGLDYPGLSPVASAEKQWNRLTEETDLDNEQHEGHIEALYHFNNMDATVTFRVLLHYNKAVLPTLCNLIPSATLYERELIEMFGVTVTGTPSTEKLLLPDDWPDGVYPLRKSFQGFPEQSERSETKIQPEGEG